MKHKVGLLCGRFQPIHNGHIEVINNALENCAHLVIAVGSAQESGTERNPFSFELRKELIIRTLRGRASRVTIIPVNDRVEILDDSSWGQYLIDEVYKQTGLVPSINFSGVESIRSHWFDGIEIEQVEIDKSKISISASKVREMLLQNDFIGFTEVTHPNIWIKFEQLKKILEEINDKKISI